MIFPSFLNHIRYCSVKTELIDRHDHPQKQRYILFTHCEMYCCLSSLFASYLSFFQGNCATEKKDDQISQSSAAFSPLFASNMCAIVSSVPLSQIQAPGKTNDCGEIFERFLQHFFELFSNNFFISSCLPSNQCR